MKPTNSELTILAILWKEGPSTVREVNEKLNIERRVGYTNTLKIMQLMHEKKLLSRNESSRSHIYSPLIKADEVKSDVLTQMIDSIFEGNTANLLVHALGNYTPSKEELHEIKSLIDKLEDDGTT
jgi:BlaI family penicillinase repressor